METQKILTAKKEQEKTEEKKKVVAKKADNEDHELDGLISPYKIVDGVKVTKTAKEMQEDYAALLVRIKAKQKQVVSTASELRRKDRDHRLCELGGVIDKVCKDKFADDHPDYTIFDLNPELLYAFLINQEKNGNYFTKAMRLPAEIGKGRDRYIAKKAREKAAKEEAARRRKEEKAEKKQKEEAEIAEAIAEAEAEKAQNSNPERY